jgi:hypothetical protein
MAGQKFNVGSGSTSGSRSVAAGAVSAVSRPDCGEQGPYINTRPHRVNVMGNDSVIRSLNFPVPFYGMDLIVVRCLDFPTHNRNENENANGLTPGK